MKRNRAPFLFLICKVSILRQDYEISPRGNSWVKESSFEFGVNMIQMHALVVAKVDSPSEMRKVELEIGYVSMWKRVSRNDET